jgi:SMI1/KNR4 family protein SUKH-1
MNRRITDMTREMRLEPGASPDLIRAVEATLGVALPTEYVEFLTNSNGGEGMVGENFLRLLPVDELLPTNARLKTAEYTLGIFVFGSNGGMTAYAFDTKSSDLPIVEMDFVDRDYRKLVAKTFAEFLEYLYSRKTGQA